MYSYPGQYQYGQYDQTSYGGAFQPSYASYGSYGGFGVGYNYGEFGLPATGYIAPQTVSHAPNYPAYGSGSFYQMPPGSFYQPPMPSFYQQAYPHQYGTQTQPSFHESSPRQQATPPTPKPEKEVVVTVEKLVDVEKTYADVGVSRYQVAAWCRACDWNDAMTKGKFSTPMVEGKPAISGDSRKEDAEFNSVKIRVPWDGEDLVQLKVSSDETMRSYQKTEGVGTLALSLMDPESKQMLAYPITGANRDTGGYIYCKAEIFNKANVPTTAPVPPTGGESQQKKKKKKASDESWCFCL